MTIYRIKYLRRSLTLKRQNHQIGFWLCLRGKLPRVINHLSPLIITLDIGNVCHFKDFEANLLSSIIDDCSINNYCLSKF
ncbi:hypothetical protein BGP_0533 [Beggiatoa sp. PS]|nr:hypothetical protein BGP_0533 [Beggiatoa sp. PS]